MNGNQQIKLDNIHFQSFGQYQKVGHLTYNCFQGYTIEIRNKFDNGVIH